MQDDDTKLKRVLLQKEEELQNNGTRSDADKVAQLIADGCIEVAASGSQHTYRTGETFGTLEGAFYIVPNSVKLVSLGEDCKVLVYTAGKINKNKRVNSTHSSVWKREGETWKVAFHQGTDCAE